MKRGVGLISAGVGAGLMYLLDPQMGRRRRALVRDRMVHWANKASSAANIAARNTMNRARGIMAEIKSEREGQPVSDEIIRERVRSQIGTIVSHPSSIEVTAENGRVALSGPILADEVDPLLERASTVQGVTGVEHRLEVHQEPGNVPGLQGEPAQRRAGGQFELLQKHWSPAARLLVGAAGSAFAVIAARRRGVFGSTLGAAGLTLLARSLTNREVKCLFGMRAEKRPADEQSTSA